MTEETEVAPQEATQEVVAEQEEATQAESSEQVDAETSETHEDEQKPKKSRHQRMRAQMDRLRTEREEAEKRAKEAESRLAEQQQLRDQLQPPKEEDYSGNYEQYQAALAGFYAMQQIDQREASRIEREQQTAQADAQRAMQAHQMEVQQHWTASVEEAKTRYADFEQVALNQNAPIPPHVAEIVLQMESGPDVAYHLGSNTDVAAQIAQMPPMMAAMELGRIQATLKQPSPQTISQAPAPTAPVRPKASSTKRAEDMTMAEYAAARKAGKIF